MNGMLGANGFQAPPKLSNMSMGKAQSQMPISGGRKQTATIENLDRDGKKSGAGQGGAAGHYERANT